MEPAVRLTNLTKRFGREIAVNDVSIEVPPGVVFALLGENGAGKTTAIRIMLGLADANSGSAEVLGLSSHEEGIEIRRRVGYVPEKPTLYDWMTVGEIGLVYRRFLWRRIPYRVPPADRSVRTAREPQAQGPFERHESQGGPLSLAMANGPELLVLDEPTSGTRRLGPPRIPRKHGRSGRQPAKPCSSPAIRSARSNVWPTLWPSCERGN